MLGPGPAKSPVSGTDKTAGLKFLQIRWKITLIYKKKSLL